MNIEQFMNCYEVENMWVDKRVEKNLKEVFERIEKNGFTTFFNKKSVNEEVTTGRLISVAQKLLVAYLN
jgi:hypothetical protein